MSDENLGILRPVSPMASARHWQPAPTSVLVPAPEPILVRNGIEFVDIPAGTFMMGSPDSEKGRYANEETAHEVHVPAFRMSKYLITEAQFGLPKSWLPVTRVSWHDARVFCDRIGCRLPTEAEWEYACRAGSTTRFYTGNDGADLDRAGWFKWNSYDSTHPVGQKEPNAFGLYDMIGNVWEWCEDDWHNDYRGAPTDGSAWIDAPRGGGRVLRGGSWATVTKLCRSASRFHYLPDRRSEHFGFRAVLFYRGPR
jgi:formylglycine-generating enzyme required for sulfatase activity